MHAETFSPGCRCVQTLVALRQTRHLGKRYLARKICICMPTKHTKETSGKCLLTYHKRHTDSQLMHINLLD